MLRHCARAALRAWPPSARRFHPPPARVVELLASLAGVAPPPQLQSATSGGALAGSSAGGGAAGSAGGVAEFARAYRRIGKAERDGVLAHLATRLGADPAAAHAAVQRFAQEAAAAAGGGGAGGGAGGGVDAGAALQSVGRLRAALAPPHEAVFSGVARSEGGLGLLLALRSDLLDLAAREKRAAGKVVATTAAAAQLLPALVRLSLSCQRRCWGESRGTGTGQPVFGTLHATKVSLPRRFQRPSSTPALARSAGL